MKKAIFIYLFSFFALFNSYGQIEPTEQETKYLSSSSKQKKNMGFALTLGGGGTYLISPLTSQWVLPENGLGILYGFLGDAQLVLNVTPKVGVMLGGGKSFTAVRKNYITEDIFQYSSDHRIDNIPIALGVRFYMGKTLYFEPQLGYNLMKLSTTTSVKHPFGQYETLDEATKFTFGGGIGVDIRKGNFSTDIKVLFMTSDNQDTFGIIQPLTYAGVRLGIGFGTKK